MLAQRRGYSATARDCASEILCGHLEDWTRREWLPGHAGPIGVYLASPLEANLDRVIRNWLHGGIPVAAPRVDVERDEISFWLIHSLDSLEPGAWGLREPPAWEPVETPGLLLVPGVAFDPRGGRLGMGGGWYDRLLAGAATSVGVAFNWQMVPDVPTEAHDRPVDAVLTPDGWHVAGEAVDGGPHWPFRK